MLFQEPCPSGLPETLLVAEAWKRIWGWFVSIPRAPLGYTVASKKLEYGPGTIYAGFPPPLGFGVVPTFWLLL